jgi:drug/metabolite transporter (DMT)-like permease
VSADRGPRIDLPRVDLHSHAGRCFLAGLPAGHPLVAALGPAAVAGAVAPLLFLAGLRRAGATQTAVLSLCEPLAATLLAAMMLRQLPAPSQLLGAALLVGAGIAVQVAPALSRLGRPHSLVRIAVSLGSIGEQQRRG